MLEETDNEYLEAENIAEQPEPRKPKRIVAKASVVTMNDTSGYGGFYMPGYSDSTLSGLGLAPEKLIVPKDYHSVIRMCYDFYQRGGSATRVIDRLQEFAITDIRNGQRENSDEQNAYFEAILHDKPSRLMRFLRTMALEFYLSGLVLPRIDWQEAKGKDLSPDLIKGKTYMVPVFDTYPPLLVHIEWINWGKKGFYLKVPEADVRTIKSQGGKIKAQQLKYRMWKEAFPSIVSAVQAGESMFQIKDSDPILRKEISLTPYPTPYLMNVLEPLVFKQQLRKMDFAVASRVISAILLVKEGNDNFPLTEETQYLLDNLQVQIMSRTGDPRKMEKLFVLFTDHTTQMEWIHPDVDAMLNQDKYREINEELDEGMGFPGVLLTGQVRQGGQTSEISTWAIQSMMEEMRGMFIEWMVQNVYRPAAELNRFKKIPQPIFKPIKLQDMIKTAAVYQQLFSEGNVSRTTRDDMAGLDFMTEGELMKDEKEIAADLPAFTPTPYSPPPPTIGGQGGRPIGSQNVPINNRNSGVKPSGQKPTSRVKAEGEMTDEEVINLIDKVARERGIYITVDDITDNSPDS